MQAPAAMIVSAGLMLVMGCASTAPTADDRVKFHVSDRADQLIAEQGKAVAAMRGYDRDSELVCERWTKTGSHITHNVCYTREEMERRRLNHQESVRFISRGGPCLPVRDATSKGRLASSSSVGCGGGR